MHSREQFLILESRFPADAEKRHIADGAARFASRCLFGYGRPRSQRGMPWHRGIPLKYATEHAPRAPVGTDMIRHWSHARQKGWGYPPKKTACQ